MRPSSLLLATGLLLLSACQPATPDQAAAPRDVTKAVAVLTPAANGEVRGTVTFTEASDGVSVTANLTGLTPGPHGFHVHEFGNIDCADGMCTGGHYNPSSSAHGDLGADERHVGDMGNIQAADDGTASLTTTISGVSLNGPHALVGHAIVVHANPDDFSQPTGNAGGRMAYGVIGIAEVR